jgi:hypothetical protein
MRALFTLCAALFTILAAVAFMALQDFGGDLGIWLHVIPASILHAGAESLGLYISSHGAIIRSAHGPPFLSPLGILLIYAVPAAFFGMLAVRCGRTRRRH